MIEPTTITNYHHTDTELEEFMLFCIAVAGHNSDTTARLVNEFLADTNGNPFTYLRSSYRDIDSILMHYRLGPYGQNVSALRGVLDLDLRTCSLHDLLKVNGIGHKTARMFLLHSRPDEEHIVLDVHVLRYLRKVCRMKKVPEKTPPKLSQRYLDIEDRAKRKVRELHPNLTFAEFDLGIWKEMSGRNKPPTTTHENQSQKET